MAREDTSKRTTLKTVLNGILDGKEGVSPVESIADDTSLTDDLGLDSLDLAEMTVHLEDEYGVDVFEDDVVDEVSEVLEKLDA